MATRVSGVELGRPRSQVTQQSRRQLRRSTGPPRPAAASRTPSAALAHSTLHSDTDTVSCVRLFPAKQLGRPAGSQHRFRSADSSSTKSWTAADRRLRSSDERGRTNLFGCAESARSDAGLICGFRDQLTPSLPRLVGQPPPPPRNQPFSRRSTRRRFWPGCKSPLAVNQPNFVSD